MKILLTNHHLVNYGGTELFTFELARTLKREGHDVCVYTKYLGKLEKDLDDIFVPVTTDITDYAAVDFDIAHVHHNITALEVRHQFPDLPIFFLSHGSIHFLEQPPLIDINISRFGAVSELIQKNLISKKVAKKHIFRVNNIINEDLFYPQSPIHHTPHKALVMSTKLPDLLRKQILNACASYSIDVRFMGGQFGEVKNSDLPEYINKSDIVFSLGRGVMEAMLCGRVPIILDKTGFDGIITPSNFQVLLDAGFTGKELNKPVSIASIALELEKYKASYGLQLRTLALNCFSSKVVVKHLLDIYESTKWNFKEKKVNTGLVEYVVKSIEANNFFGYNSIYPLHAKIVRSKFYKVWTLLNKLKRFR